MLFCLPPDFFRAGRAFAVARGRVGTIPPPFPYIASPGQSRYKKDHRAAGPSGLLPATPTPCSAMTDEIVCRIDALSHDGRGLHRPEDGGPVIFVAGSLPGQTVRARIIRRQKRFWEAQRTAVLEDVALAADICPHGEDCGGCPWQRLPYAAQLRWKGQLVRDALERIGGLGRDAALPLRPALGSPEQRAFRNKMEFAFGPADGSLCLGLRRRGGLQVLPVPGCALLPGEGLELVTACAGLAARSGLPAYVPPRSAAEEGRLRPRADKGRGRRPRRGRPGAEDCGFWRFLVVRYGWPDPDPAQVAASDAPGRRWWLTCVTSPGTAEQRRTVARMGRELLDAFPCVQAFVHEERATPDALVAGERRVLCLDRRGEALPDDGAPLYLPLGGRWFGLDPASFFQVNSRAAELLAATAVEMLLSPWPDATPRRLLDVYCGAGAPGLLAAGHFDEVLGMEYDRRAVLLAERNARRFGFGHCRYEAGDAARLLTALAREHGPGHWDHALLDPPRGGVAPEALEALLHLAPERLVYISCNPATLARDARALSADYELMQVTPLDLFPHSPHVESVSCWQRRA